MIQPNVALTCEKLQLNMRNHICDPRIQINLAQEPKQTCCDGSEPLLTSCVPDLQFDPFAIKLNGSYLEINTAALYIELDEKPF